MLDLVVYSQGIRDGRQAWRVSLDTESSYESKINVNKHVDNSTFARFYLFGFYLIDRKCPEPRQEKFSFILVKKLLIFVKEDVKVHPASSICTYIP